MPNKRAFLAWAKIAYRWVRWVVTCVTMIAYVVAIVVLYRLLHSHWTSLEPHSASEWWATISALGSAVSALAAIAVAGFALRGLRSLRLTRAEMVDRAKREAKMTAIHRLEELAKEIIPMNTPILDAMAGAGVAVFVQKSGDVRFDPDPTDLAGARGWVAKLPPGLHADIRTFLNRLEAWCVYFTKGLADDDVAIGPVGPLLRAWVGQYYPVLVLARSERRSGNFPNIVMLYGVWTNKMNQQQLELLHADLVAQLNRQKSNMAKAPQLPGIHGAKVEE